MNGNSTTPWRRRTWPLTRTRPTARWMTATNGNDAREDDGEWQTTNVNIDDERSFSGALFFFFLLFDTHFFDVCSFFFVFLFNTLFYFWHPFFFLSDTTFFFNFFSLFECNPLFFLIWMSLFGIGTWLFIIIYIYVYNLFLSAMTSAIFHYAIRHIFMADFWLSAMNRHPPLTTLYLIKKNCFNFSLWC